MGLLSGRAGGYGRPTITPGHVLVSRRRVYAFCTCPGGTATLQLRANVWSRDLTAYIPAYNVRRVRVIQDGMVVTELPRDFFRERNPVTGCWEWPPRINIPMGDVQKCVSCLAVEIDTKEAATFEVLESWAEWKRRL